MKILFLVYHGFSEVSGISKKIHYQVKGLRQNGHEVHLCYYDVGQNGHWQRLVDEGTVIEDYGTGRMAGLEIPTYPYDQEFEGFSRIERLQLRIDQIFRKGLARHLEAIVTFTNLEQIFGQRTIRISNGVDFDCMPLHQKVDTTKELHLIGVAEVHYWHGFDRLIAGLGEYYRQPNVKPVYFHIVGGIWRSEMYNDEHAPGANEHVYMYDAVRRFLYRPMLYVPNVTGHLRYPISETLEVCKRLPFFILILHPGGQ